ncbi:MAG: mechanosensitive ion channel [Flavobacteriales bacterium]|nr:mechanosensitive ion channel [Flavobacteriales bacterium]
MEEQVDSIWAKIQEILEFHLIDLGTYQLSIYNIIVVLFIILIARLFTKTFANFLKEKINKEKDINDGKELALLQIGKYVIYLLTFLLVFRSIGIDITPFIIGSSALFVGLGFGLQDAFKDFISGLILLFEGNVVIGDIIEFENGILGKVKQISLRTSKVRTRDGIVLIVPNSQLTNNRVINWTNSNILTRFHISVGVAYGSDTKLVEQLLIDVAKEDPSISERIVPFVRFLNFGESSLDFELHFWSEEIWKIEFTKSRMRFEIDQKFRDNNISIPFPQRDLHLKSSNINLEKS